MLISAIANRTLTWNQKCLKFATLNFESLKFSNRDLPVLRNITWKNFLWTFLERSERVEIKMDIPRKEYLQTFECEEDAIQIGGEDKER